MSDIDLDLDIEIEEEDVIKKKENNKQDLKLKSQIEDLIDIKSTNNDVNLFEKVENEKSLENIRPIINDNQQTKNDFSNLIQETNENQSKFANLNSKMQGPIISWKDEVMKGNFMPAIYLLNSGKINVNDVVCLNTNNRILHFAATFSYLNVCRCLVEIFKADLNLQNNSGHSSLHIIANNTTKDIYLLAFALSIENVNTEIVDGTKVTPIFYSVMSNFNEGFMLLLSKGANIDHIDSFSNNIGYLSICNGNKFAFRYIMNHSNAFNLNESYFNGELTLSEVLMKSSNSNICKFLAKNYSNQISVNSLLASNKDRQTLSKINTLNYEILNTTFNYKINGGIVTLLKFLAGIFNYEYKTYILSFLIYDLIIGNFNSFLKPLLVLAYTITITFIYLYLFDTFYFHLDSSDTDILSFDTLIKIYQLSTLIGLIMAIFKFFSIWIRGFTEDNVYKEYPTSQSNRNIINSYKKSIKNAIDTPIVTDICEICLVEKEYNVSHCSTTNHCVKDFHFYSKILNICVSRSTFIYYFMYLNSIFGMQTAILFDLFYIVDFNVRKQTGVNVSIYKSEYKSYNLLLFFFNLDFMTLIFALYLLITSFYILQIILTLLVARGSGSTYYILFNLNKPIKKPILRLRNQKLSVTNVPPGPLVSLQKFVYNACCGGESEEVGLY